MTLRLNSFLSSNQELRQISDKIRQLRIIQQHYANIAPSSLLRASHVVQTEHNILTVAANNSAIAAKLRQMAPELVRQLHLHGCEVTGIQVRVQVTPPHEIHTHTPASLSEQGKQQLNELAETLSDSPLKSAIQRLAATKKDVL